MTTQSNINSNNLIWIDLEMTGLDPNRDRIIEIATIVTDSNLNILAEGPVIAVHQSDEQQWVPENCSPICGNTIGQDRRFLFNYMPNLEKYFHYRYLDVSTIKELARRWKPEILKGISKQSSHQALDDIRDSIAELVYYRQHFFNLTNE